MVSDSGQEGGDNPGDIVFRGLPVGCGEVDRFTTFLTGNDISENTLRAIAQDARQFVVGFTAVRGVGR